MRFVLRENLKAGMRLARPIYNREGILLFNIGSRLTEQGIVSVNNFEIIGLYILDDAEPAPPISDEDKELERFQIVSTAKLYSDWSKIREGRRPLYLPSLTAEIMSKFGNLDHKINFNQTIRSHGDKYYKHSLNSAILSAMICSKLSNKTSEMKDCVTAALLHDMGMLDIPPELRDKTEEEMSESEKKQIFVSRYKGTNFLENKVNDMPGVRTIMSQHIRMRRMESLGKLENEARWYPDTVKILTVACAFDRLTSMNLGKHPMSELTAIRILRHNPDFFDTSVVTALMYSINVMIPGCSVILTNNESGCVLKENMFNISKPCVILYSNNDMLDLSDTKTYGTLAVKDTMKTLDNRWVVDREFLDKYQATLKAAK